MRWSEWNDVDGGAFKPRVEGHQGSFPRRDSKTIDASRLRDAGKPALVRGNVFLEVLSLRLIVQKVRSFSAHSTQPTVEDTGTAQLVAGAAGVRLDPAFAASIEPTAAYRVFVTPNGGTRGLFVASKSAGGFVVRESQAGR